MSRKGQHRMSEEYPKAARPSHDFPPPPPLQTELPPPVGREGYRRGDENPGVVALQMRLGCPGTGIYDAVTEYAVRRFQQDRGWNPDGIADVNVHNALGLAWVTHA
jgi:peptidoglycan hydrolase-like protein with peptidoglycan-binding domain